MASSRAWDAVMQIRAHSVDLIHFGNVDLDAPYQRDVVWTEGKMIGLIGSLFFVGLTSCLCA